MAGVFSETRRRDAWNFVWKTSVDASAGGMTAKVVAQVSAALNNISISVIFPSEIVRSASSLVAGRCRKDPRGVDEEVT
jgi:hypothetical protein